MFYTKEAPADKHPLVKYFKSWAREQLFKLPKNLKLAVLDNTMITMLNLEQGIPGTEFLRLYYIKYLDNTGTKLLKHKKLNVQNPN